MRLVWPDDFVQNVALLVKVGRALWGVVGAAEFNTPDPFLTIDNGDVDSKEILVQCWSET